MDSFYFMLQKIRERPGLFMGKKSLEALTHFWSGYDYRGWVENWEKTTGRGFFENYEEAQRSSTGCEPREQHFMYGFEAFVHEYYDCMITTNNAMGLILEKSNSDEEAFDKFFELLDEFLTLTDEQKNKIMENAQKRFQEYFEDI